MQNRNLKALQEFVDMTQEIAIIVNKNNIIAYANKEFLNALNLTFEDVFDKNYMAIVNFDIAQNNHYINIDDDKYQGFDFRLNEEIKQFKLIFFRLCSKGVVNNDKLADSTLIFNSIPDILSVHDINDRVLYYNKAGYEFLQMQEKDVIGKKCYNLIGNKIKCSDCPAAESIKTGNVVQKVSYFPELKKWLDIRAYPIKNKEGKVVQIIEHLRDITEQKTIEQKFKETEVQLGLLMEHIPGVVYRCKNDINWTMIFMSNETKNLTGYEPHEFVKLKKNFQSIIHPEDRDKVAQAVLESIKKNTSFVIEYRIITKDNKIKHVWEKGKFVKDSDNFEHIDGVILDITERKNIESNLKVSEEKYRLLVENQNDFIIKLNKHGTILFVNKAYSKHFGKQESEIIGKNFMNFIHVDDKTETSLAFTKLNNPPHTGYLEHKTLTKNGWRWLAWSNTAIIKDNKITEIIAVGRDITDKKNIEFELFEAKAIIDKNDKLKNIFFNNINNKIQDPIKDIIKNISDKEKNDSDLQFKKSLDSSLKQIQDFVDKLSEIAVIESGQVELNNTHFELYDFLKKTFKQCAKFHINKNIEYKYIIDNQDSVIINSDKEKLEIIIKIFLKNAFNNTQTGQIVLSTKKTKDDFKIIISDTGKGINKDKLSKINDYLRFKSDSSHTLSNGFGIIISKAYVDLLNGNLKINSRLGEGTKAIISIPLSTDFVELKDDSRSNKTPDLSNYTILVAEDEKINYQLLKTILTKAGANVIRAESGIEAIENVKNNNAISLVLMDIKMPGLSGDEALKEIRKINENLKVVACTAYTQSEDSESFSKKEFDGFLPKPVKRKQLFDLIKKLTLSH